MALLSHVNTDIFYQLSKNVGNCFYIDFELNLYVLIFVWYFSLTL